MTSRTYLSIGDVLTLLREEFPDVTISKIRFLESQGLVNPERSPSGYRKFYDHDVERLRWVLRQQREHFLPLKVIRDRLAAEGDAALAGPVPADAPFSGDRPAVVGGHGAEAAGPHTNGLPAHSEEPALALSGSVQRPPSATHQAATAGSSFERPSSAARRPRLPPRPRRWPPRHRHRPGGRPRPHPVPAAPPNPRRASRHRARPANRRPANHRPASRRGRRLDRSPRPRHRRRPSPNRRLPQPLRWPRRRPRRRRPPHRRSA